MENLGKQLGTTEANKNNRIQGTEDRISGTEDMIEEIDSQVKEMLNSTNS